MVLGLMAQVAGVRVMNNNERSADMHVELDEPSATFTAESLEHDFAELIAIFDIELERLGDGDAEARSRIVEAKAAAGRGLKLSQQLVELQRRG